MTPTPDPARVSVIVVSRERPEYLALCLAALSRLVYPTYEIIVVADPAGLAATAPYAGKIKTVAFDTANIAEARNLGIAAAAGEIIAFIDDDAVAEPTWLYHLIAPFADRAIAMTGGFVRGRNGISWQWRARAVDGEANHRPLPIAGMKPQCPPLGAGMALKTEGTNMAFRREVLARIGGFDPAFAFFLDETDVNYRLAQAGHNAVVVPLAQVHHAYAPSVRRGANRAVLDLHQIGFSLAIYLRKHCQRDRHAARWQTFQAEQRARLADQMRRGLLRRGAIAPLLAGLSDGYAAGQTARLTGPLPSIEQNQPFLPFATLATAGATILAGRPWNARHLRREAQSRAARGESVSLYLFSPTLLYHRVRFRPEGFWEQTGGLWGRSERAAPLLQPFSFARRLQSEVRRTAEIRFPAVN